ncbi:hypothetical protein ACFLQN_03575 [Candidatus Aenigmatarchaeota archaeon]
MNDDVYDGLFHLEKQMDRLKERVILKLVHFSDARKQMQSLREKHNGLLIKLDKDERESYLFKTRNHGLEI